MLKLIIFRVYLRLRAGVVYVGLGAVGKGYGVLWNRNHRSGTSSFVVVL